jgi:hypothetical protein
VVKPCYTPSVYADSSRFQTLHGFIITMQYILTGHSDSPHQVAVASHCGDREVEYAVVSRCVEHSQIVKRLIEALSKRSRRGVGLAL